jgi:hypothetical protein
VHRFIPLPSDKLKHQARDVKGQKYYKDDGNKKENAN